MKNKTIEQVEPFDEMWYIAKTFGVVTNLKIYKGITKYTIKNNVENTLTVHCKIISANYDSMMHIIDDLHEQIICVRFIQILKIPYMSNSNKLNITWEDIQGLSWIFYED